MALPRTMADAQHATFFVFLISGVIAVVGIVVVGYGVGCGCALFHPFTVQIAQRMAELPPGSGMWYRAILAGPFFLIGFHHVYRYARRTMADPASILTPIVDLLGIHRQVTVLAYQ